MMGRIVAVCRSDDKGTSKETVQSACVKESYGLMDDCIMPKEGVFARVIRGGVVKPGDTISVVRTQNV